MNGAERGAFVGRSSEEPQDEEPTLEKAMRNAYRKATAGKPAGQKTFRVVGIRIEGTNPPTDYIVDLDEDVPSEDYDEPPGG